MAAKKPASKRKKKISDEQTHRRAMLGIFACGLFAVAFAILEGFVFKSSGVYTGRSGTFTMDPITSILFLLAGLIGIGFAAWGWFNPPKS